MNWNALTESALLLFVLLNPFLMSAYLIGLIEELDRRQFAGVMIRASLISASVFILFALAGDRIFSDVLQVRFGAFLIFGGVIFLLIAVQFVQKGKGAITMLRGSPDHLAGAVAMPFMIGPGTVSASVLAGSRLPFLWATLAIVTALTWVALSLIAMKMLHDVVRERNESLVERYMEIVGRISGLVIGTIAVEMVLQGVDLWLGLNSAGGA